MLPPPSVRPLSLTRRVSPLLAEMRLERRLLVVPPRGIVSGALVATAPPLAFSSEPPFAEADVGTGVADEPVARRAGTASAVLSLESFGESVEEIPDARLEIALQPAMPPPKSATQAKAPHAYAETAATTPPMPRLGRRMARER